MEILNHRHLRRIAKLKESLFIHATFPRLLHLLNIGHVTLKKK